MDRPTKLARVAEVRANALRIVKESGAWDSSGDVKCLRATVADLVIMHHTPFQKMFPETDQAKYMKAMGFKINLPYGLDIWHDRKKVLNVEWSDDGALEVISYRPGEWERALEPA